MPRGKRENIHTIPLNIGDFLSGTSDMSTLEVGAYIRLLLKNYSNGLAGLPDNDGKLARIAGLTMDKWKRVAPTLRAKFPKGADGNLHNARARQVLEKIFGTDTSFDDKPAENGQSDIQPDVPGLTDPISNIHHPKNKDRSDQGPVDNGDNSAQIDGMKTIGSVVGSDFLNFGLDRYDIQAFLTDNDRIKARAALKGDDLYYYVNIFNQAVRDRRFEKPRIPGNAFISWLIKYKNGKGDDRK